MVNLLQRGASFLATKLQSSAVAGRTVRYWRGQVASEAIQAWVSSHIEQSQGEENFDTTFTVYDWSFETADLLNRGEAIEPRIGDKITETLNGQEIEYEVLVNDTGKCFEHPDTSKLMTKVFTKRVS